MKGLQALIQNREDRFLLITLVLLVLALFLNLGLSPFFQEEPRRALIGLEMLYQDNLLVPTEIGELYYKKPPLFNWLLIAAFKLSGSFSEFAARTVTVLSLLLTGLVTFLALRKYLGREIAIYSALFFMVSADILFSFSMLAEIDLFFTLITWSFFLALFHFHIQKQYWHFFIIGYGLIAIGVLTKGLPSLVFLAISGAVFFLWLYRKALIRLVSLPHLTGLALLVLIVGGYAYAYSEYNDPRNYLGDLWSQSSDRTVLHKGFGAMLLHLVRFPVLVLKDILPAALLLPFAFSKSARKALWENEFLRYCFWMFVANILIYWISPGTRSRYVYMLYPFPIIMLVYLYFQARTRMPAWEKVLKWVAGFLLVVPMAGMLALPFIPDLKPYGHILPAVLICVPLMGLVFWLFLKNSKPLLMWLVMAAVCGRVLFDIFVLPIRGQVGEHVDFKRDAERMVEITKGKPLHLYNFRGDGTYSLGSVFYLEKGRGEVLDVWQDKNCEDFFIVLDQDIEKVPHEKYHAFEWRNMHFFLVKFRDCRTERMGQPLSGL